MQRIATASPASGPPLEASALLRGSSIVKVYQPEPDDDDLVNLRQIANILGVHEQTIYTYRRRGSFPRDYISDDRLDSRSRFYRWSDVSYWARHRTGQGYRRDLDEPLRSVKRFGD